METWPDTIEGQPVGVGRFPKTGPLSYHRLRVSCPRHVDCYKSRNTGAAQRGSLGHVGPIAYLAVWISAASRTSRHEHQYEFQPSWKEMELWADAQGQNVCRALRTLDVALETVFVLLQQ